MSRSMIRRPMSRGEQAGRQPAGPPVGPEGETGALSADLWVNLCLIRDALGNSMDLIIREFTVGKVPAALVCLDGMVNKDVVSEDVLKPLMRDYRLAEDRLTREGFLALVKEKSLVATDFRETCAVEKMLDGLLAGDTILFFHGLPEALLVDTAGWKSRNVEEPVTETVVRGPREGFTECLQTNTALLRRKLKSPSLRLESLVLGRVTNTKVCIAYLDGIANKKIVDEVRKRLKRIDLDGVLESGYLEQFIEDAPFSIFPMVGNTEKPDIVAARMLEGRVAVLTDGTPMALTVPHLFFECLQSGEDYYSRIYSALPGRLLRLLALVVTTTLPALYVALETFHPEMIPTVLMITMAATKEGIPFPALAEMLLMLTIFELLREAGVRMPRPMGQAISIVGALVLGEAAIQAGIVSPPAVITTALTAIAGFLVASQVGACFFMRLALLLLAGFLGFFGLFLGAAVLVAHLVSLRSFGVPYFAPFAPFNPEDQKDMLVRLPLWAMVSRPRLIGWKNPRRLGTAAIPRPPREGEKGS